MANDNETVEQLCADIKTRIEELWEQDLGAMLNGEVDEFADRIIDAHKREIADEKRISDSVIKSLRDKKLEMAGEIADKDAEIDKLRAALKPVLECKVISAMTVETRQGEGEYCAAIIEKAQLIYNEGEENRNE